MTIIAVTSTTGRVHLAADAGTTIDGRTMSLALVFERTLCGQEIPFGRGWFEPEPGTPVGCAKCQRAKRQRHVLDQAGRR